MSHGTHCREKQARSLKSSIGGAAGKDQQERAAADGPLLLAHCNRPSPKLEQRRRASRADEIFLIQADLDRLPAELGNRYPAPDKSNQPP